ncbi:MAG TPA: hypothetical protein VJH03_08360 [Blastocatellia bacterium]|nr:hypothetical protein [Blastocatellia bacterium]
MLYKKARVGKEISAYCGKCKLERTHTIAAMDGEAVRKVTCTTCGSNHNYKAKAPVGAAAKPKKVKQQPDVDGAVVPKAKPSGTKRTRDKNAYSIDPKRPIKSYNMNSAFATGDVINHPKFGLGNVETALPPNKIEVRFQEGKKLLLHNMKFFRP